MVRICCSPKDHGRSCGPRLPAVGVRNRVNPTPTRWLKQLSAGFAPPSRVGGPTCSPRAGIPATSPPIRVPPSSPRARRTEAWGSLGSLGVPSSPKWRTKAQTASGTLIAEIEERTHLSQTGKSGVSSCHSCVSMGPTPRMGWAASHFL